MKFQLGETVKDRISGYVGVVCNYANYKYSAPRVGIQSEGLDKDGKPIESIEVDAAQVVSIDAKHWDVQFPPPKYEFGQTVKDLYTGYEGKITGRCLYLNGCVRVCVQPEWNSKKEKIDSGIWFPEEQVLATGPLIKKDVEPPVKTGGPMDSMPSPRM